MRDDLSTVLLELAKYGKVRIGQYASTKWHCQMELFLTGVGVSVEVKSSYDHETPISAAMECSSRLIAIINEMKSQTNPNLPTIGG